MYTWLEYGVHCFPRGDIVEERDCIPSPEIGFVQIVEWLCLSWKLQIQILDGLVLASYPDELSLGCMAALFGVDFSVVGAPFALHCCCKDRGFRVWR